MSNPSGKGSLGRKIRLAFILLCFVVLGIMIFQNRDPVETRLLFSNVSMPLAALLFVTVSIGMLTIVRAMASLPESARPKRSILFASVGAEEQGLLGSKFLAHNPPIPAGRLAAVINIDGINILGPTTDVVVVGKGKSDLDQIVERNAVWQNRVVVGDPFPDHGSYYRSDQFSLAKVGVPGVYLGSGVNVIGKPEGWGVEKQREWTDNIYHQTSDEYDPEWDPSGAVEDTKLMFYVGMQVANQSALPAWNPGDEFEAARMEALKAVE